LRLSKEMETYLHDIGTGIACLKLIQKWINMVFNYHIFKIKFNFLNFLCTFCTNIKIYAKAHFKENSPLLKGNFCPNVYSLKHCCDLFCTGFLTFVGACFVLFLRMVIIRGFFSTYLQVVIRVSPLIVVLPWHQWALKKVSQVRQ
jgi:hypothetical protein